MVPPGEWLLTNSVKREFSQYQQNESTQEEANGPKPLGRDTDILAPKLDFEYTDVRPNVSSDG